MTMNRYGLSAVLVAVMAFAPVSASFAQTTHHHRHRTAMETRHHHRPADKNPARRVGGYVQTGARKAGGNVQSGARATGGAVQKGSRKLGGNIKTGFRKLGGALGGHH